jgi:flagellar motility protein MotE (MotC chaperone)
LNKDCTIYLLCPIANEADRELAKAEEMLKQARVLEQQAIEKRTKYIIQMNERLRNLEKENKLFRKKIKALEDLVNALIK